MNPTFVELLAAERASDLRVSGRHRLHGARRDTDDDVAVRTALVRLRGLARRLGSTPPGARVSQP